MPCYYPLEGFISRYPSKNGKFPVVFNRDKSFGIKQVVPCGQCVGCRLERSRQWAIRCVHEASLYSQNCFLTLTYSTPNLPKLKSLVKSHFQKFMKRLRKRIGVKVRFFHCGEYGSKYGRPHYHVLLFGYDFADKYLHTYSNGQPLFRSPLLESLWTYGYSSIGSVTFDSAAYVARYIMKKVTGDESESHYRVINDDGEVLGSKLPEYTTMSRRPGIGKRWMDKFSSDVYPSDELELRGRVMKPPKYYDSLFEVENPDEFSVIKRKRKLVAKSKASRKNEPSLKSKLVNKLSDVSRLVRNVEVVYE